MTFLLQIIITGSWLVMVPIGAFTHNWPTAIGWAVIGLIVFLFLVEAENAN